MIDNIAKALGVSKTTVSRAISGNGRVSEKTRERILRYTAEIGYVPNAAASNLATTRTRNIAFSMPLNRDATRSAYFLECFFGVSKMASTAAYDVIMVGDRLEQISRIIQSRKADGMVLTRHIIGDADLEKLAQSGIPIVLTGVTLVPNIMQVFYDSVEAFKDLTWQLLDLWVGPVGLIVTNKAYPANQARAQAFTDAVTSKDMPKPLVSWDADTEEDMIGAFTFMLSKGIKNIICGDDVICATLLNITSDNDINLASFHDSHYLKTFHPEIPVVTLDPGRLGDVACQKLLSKIKGMETPLTTQLDYKFRL
ncbi:MAG: LacI family transcriptional regulator [Defluviitaleaceae bacterium]|nr:LacI family transcriptional regulator [Defluviitaleaceae bacterium]